MTGLGLPLFRVHARANLVLAVLVTFASALLAGSLNVLVAAASDRYLPAAGIPDDPDLSGGTMSVMGWTLALTVFSGASLVASLTAFTVDARLPELARLRLGGATGRQVSRGIVTEVVGVGLISSVLGTVLGWPAGELICSVLVRMDFAPPGLDVTPVPWSPVAVVGVGVVVAFIGAGPAARRAGRTDPLVAVTDVVPVRRAMTVGRWVVAVLTAGCVAALASARVTDVDDVFGTSMLLTLASLATLACLAPVVVPAVVRVLGAPLARWSPGPGLLAVEHTRHAVRRTAALALPVLLVVGLSGGLLTILDTANGGPGTDTRADLVVLGAADPRGRVVADVPGVASVVDLEVLEVSAVSDRRDADDEPEREVWRLGAIDLPAAGDAGFVTTVQRDDVERPGPTRVFRDAPADAHALPVASTDPGILPLGSALAVVSGADPPVVLVVTSVVEIDPVLTGEVLIDPALVGPWAVRVESAAVVTLVDSADADAVRATLAVAAGGAEVLTGAALARGRTDAADRHNRNAVLAILGGGIAMAACSIVLGGLSGSADRRRELALLVRAGATNRQLLGAALVETVLVLSVAAALAAAAVAWVAWRLDVLLGGAGGPRVAIGVMGLALGSAALLAIVATLGGTAWQLGRLARG